MNSSSNRRERTLFVSILDNSVTDDYVYELLTQAGPIEKIVFRQNKIGNSMHALVFFRNVESVVFSMVHLAPIVRKCGLMQIRPLRESSHHYPFETRYHHTFANGVSLNEMGDHSRDLNDIASWTTHHQIDKPVSNLSFSVSIDATCVTHPSHSIIPKLYSSQSPSLAQVLPCRCNSAPAHIGSSNLRPTYSSVCRFHPHRGMCSKICRTGT